MSWKLPIFGGGQQQQAPSIIPDIPTQSWYPPSVLSSSLRLSAASSSSSVGGSQKTPDGPAPNGQPSPAGVVGIIARLKEKRQTIDASVHTLSASNTVDELRKLLALKESYNAFFNSLDQVKIQNNVRDELRKETLQLARENLEKEPCILELRNQCTVIRTTELAAAQEKLAELERQKEETLRSYSPAALLEKLHEAMNEVDEESEQLHTKLLEKEVDLPAFVQKYKKLRTTHHRRALLHLAANTAVC